jgi:ABC-2 type transport system ATP-binding protein
MIEIKNMNFGYVSPRRIFDNLNLSLGAGHIYGLLGKNGVGKTTLLKIISGLRFCNSGTVSTFGMKPEQRNPEMLADIYFVTEEMDVPTVSVSEYVKIYAPFYPNFSNSDFENYLRQFEIADMEQKLTKMSHGQKKKVLVSFALATNTKLLIMDEPTNGMDIPSKSTFRKVVASAITDDKAFIISTHQVRDLQNVIDAVLVLDRGEILLNADINTICDRLTFKVLSADEFDELSQQGKVLYSEDNIAGKVAVCTHIDDADDKFDMELLFCAAISAREKMRKIFAESENGKSRFASDMETKLNN